MDVAEAIAEIAGLAARYSLPVAATAQLGELLRLLSADPLAPTSLREPGRVVDDHLADSLVALELEQVRSARTVVDVGSGPGLPGLPLAIALPGGRFVLVEAAARKCQFLERAVAACGLTNVEVVHERAESWVAGRGRFDLVVVRAVAALDVVLEYSAPLLGLGGTLLAWRGRRDPDGEAAAEVAGHVLGVIPTEIRPVQPYVGAHDRHLHLFTKVRATPQTFPRRSGMAAKRPLGRR
jgi:16S rRNA (guanine527-N7)-methyltransferase